MKHGLTLNRRKSQAQNMWSALAQRKVDLDLCRKSVRNIVTQARHAFNVRIKGLKALRRRAAEARNADGIFRTRTKSELLTAAKHPRDNLLRLQHGRRDPKSTDSLRSVNFVSADGHQVRTESSNGEFPLHISLHRVRVADRLGTCALYDLERV